MALIVEFDNSGNVIVGNEACASYGKHVPLLHCLFFFAAKMTAVFPKGGVAVAEMVLNLDKPSFKILGKIDAAHEFTKFLTQF